MINREEVKHISKLARLNLSEKEESQMEKELSAILDYIEKLKKADIKDVEPTSHSIPVKNILRKDQELEKDSHTREKLIDQFPEKQDNYLKVKSIL